MEQNLTEHTKTYWPFSFAVVTYVAGVVAFSAWSYFKYRALLELHDAASLRRQLSSQAGWAACSEVLFLILMAFPLIALYKRAGTRSSLQEKSLNSHLQQDNDQLKEHEKQLEHAIQDLERFNTLATGRELRIIELKREVNGLLEEMNRPKRYATTPAD